MEDVKKNSGNLTPIPIPVDGGRNGQRAVKEELERQRRLQEARRDLIKGAGFVFGAIGVVIYILSYLTW